jgi:hypothetical protein
MDSELRALVDERDKINEKIDAIIAIQNLPISTRKFIADNNLPDEIKYLLCNPQITYRKEQGIIYIDIDVPNIDINNDNGHIFSIELDENKNAEYLHVGTYMCYGDICKYHANDCNITQLAKFVIDNHTLIVSYGDTVHQWKRFTDRSSIAKRLSLVD